MEELIPLILTDLIPLLPGFIIAFWYPHHMTFGFNDEYRVMRQATEEASKRRARFFGVVGVSVGLIVGVLAPVYLALEGLLAVSAVLVGGAAFFVVGVGSLTVHAWGYTSFAFGLLGFAAVGQFVIVCFQEHLSIPLLLKFLLLATLCVAALILATVVSTQRKPGLTRGTQHTDGPLLVEKVSFWISAILTILEFINLMFGLLERAFS